MKGLIFAVEEFAVHDGPGLRCAVFFKGCPLRCEWCHNPEGLEMHPQRLRNMNGCLRCGTCNDVCPTPDDCTACGRCVVHCPRDLIRISGEWQEASVLAQRILRFAPQLMQSGGGVTLTGGEALLQADFVLELLPLLSPLHRALETSGYVPTAVFEAALRNVELVYLDMKHMFPEQHRRYTGASNALVLRNAGFLLQGATPFIVRIPLIRGVTDSVENLRATACFLKGASTLLHVELLPYNEMAGAKYALLGQTYSYAFHAPEDSQIEECTAVFSEYGIKTVIRARSLRH